MASTTILFETVTAAESAYDALKLMTGVVLDCNAVTYNQADQELVQWLVQDKYCRAGAQERVYLYPVNVIEQSLNRTFFQYQDLQIEQIFIPPTDWEFIARNSQGEILDRTWWSYEDGYIDIGFYIEKFLLNHSLPS
ncbi:MAG: hypothetical protein QNJ55_11800 [Xenococcus sp. MO_188.B8]|nr:hypothetical protein [Xenococcus sp. MO_188.B8]